MGKLCVKGQTVNFLGFAGHAVSVTNTQLCYYSVTAAIGSTQKKGYGYAPVQLCSQDNVHYHSLLPSGLEEITPKC